MGMAEYPSKQLCDEMLARAARLSLNGTGTTSPNPRVGAVVAVGSTILSEGWHERYGEQHAEVHALNQLHSIPAEAVLYVTLEPCNHSGKQPPCTHRIVQSGIQTVVAGMADPNPTVRGGGIDFLLTHGVRACIHHGTATDTITRINRAYIKAVKTGMPYIVVKIAQSSNGIMAPLGRSPISITGVEARTEVHRLRAEFDAVMVGMGTVIADNPRLNVRYVQGRDPARIVVSSAQGLPSDSYLYQTRSVLPTYEVVTTFTTADRSHFIDQLKALTLNGITGILCEPGPGLAAWLFALDLVDELHLHTAPVRIESGRSSNIPFDRFTRYSSQQAGADTIEILLRNGH